jgi:hypothetical protein
MLGPLGNYAIAQSLVQTPGWKALEAEENEMLPGGGRGGGGFGMSFGQQPYNDMERTLLAHDEPGSFKVTTDAYAAKYSDQLDQWALEEMKGKFPQGPKGGGTWEQEFARQAALKNKGKLWGVPEHLQKKITLGPNYLDKKFPNVKKNYAVKDDYSTGWVKPKTIKKAKTVWGVSPGAGNSRRITGPSQSSVYRNIGRFR